MVKNLGLVFASLTLAACVANDNQLSSSSMASSKAPAPSSSSLTASSSSAKVVPSSSSLRSSSSLAVVLSSAPSSVPSSAPISSSSAPKSSSSVAVSSSSSVSSAAPTGNFDLAKGKALYATHCVECHGVTGGGTIKLPVPIKAASLSALLARVDGGNMPTGKGPLTGTEYSPSQCVGDCAYQIAGYVTNGFPGALDTGESSELGFAGCNQAEGAPAARAIRLLTRREFQNSINDIFKTKLDLVANFPPEGRDHGFSNNADIAQVTARHLDEYYSAATRVGSEVTNQNNFNASISQNGPNCNSNEHCLEQVLDSFGTRIFRRLLTNEEKTDYLKFFKQGITDFNHTDHFRQAVRQGITALLMSPHFLYRKELGQAKGDVYQLDDFEMATLLAYTYIGSTPDDILLQAARNQQVRTKQQFKEQAERLLKTEKGKNQMAYFAVEWWNAGLELIGSKNTDFYKDYDATVIRSMVGEQEAFFKHVVFESTGKFQELYTPGYVMLNDTLSKFYGVGSGLTSTFTKVATTQRGGILTMGGILAKNASTEESSPVKRGVFVREQLLCDPLPPFPRDVNIPNPDLDPTKSMRTRFEEHSANENCWACHKFFDDLGFALENFDASGKYREREKMYNWDTKEIIDELKIDTKGQVINVDGDDVKYFDGYKDLSELFAKADSTKSCLTTNYYRYVAGYKLTDADQCAIENLNKTFADSEFDIKTLLIGITQLDSFSVRK